jgi:hypothetical protein
VPLAKGTELRAIALMLFAFKGGHADFPLGRNQVVTLFEESCEGLLSVATSCNPRRSKSLTNISCGYEFFKHKNEVI